MLPGSAFASVVLGLAFTAAAQRVCNNAAALCERKYNEIAHLGAHDSPFVRNKANNFNIFGDQYYDSITQLNAGVRLLSAQVHQNNTSWDLCHTGCAFIDAGPLTDWLNGLKSWLDNHPTDVVTILLVNSNNADATTLNQLFQAANIVNYAYTPASTTTATSDWPTLNQMIDQNKRLVVFIANLPPSSNTVAPYLLDEFTFVFENSYDNNQPTDFSCEPDRPTGLRTQAIDSVLSSGYMPLMNHFLYDNAGGVQFPAEGKLNNTNADSGAVGNLGDAANNCTTFYGRAPTYILVDFFNVARSITTVDRLNRVTGQTSGRIELPDTVPGSMATTVSSSATIATTASRTPGSFVSGTSTSPGGTASPAPGSGSEKVSRRPGWAIGGAAIVAAAML